MTPYYSTMFRLLEVVKIVFEGNNLQFVKIKQPNSKLTTAIIPPYKTCINTVIV